MFKKIKISNNSSILNNHKNIKRNIKKDITLFKTSNFSCSKDKLNDQTICQLIKKAKELNVPDEFINLIISEHIKKNEQLSKITQERDDLREANKALKNNFKTLQSKFKTTKIELEKVRKDSETDPLTGIYNRRGILRRLNKEIKNAHESENPLVLLLIDGDNFKSYNENYCYEVGDQVLKHIVNSAKSHIRENDIIGRLGGEEFIVVLPQTKLEDSLKVAERIRQAVNTDFACNFNNQTHILKPSISIGLSTKNIIKPIDDDNAITLEKEIIKEANIKLKKAKATGKNKIVVV